MEAQLKLWIYHFSCAWFDYSFSILIKFYGRQECQLLRDLQTVSSPWSNLPKLLLLILKLSLPWSLSIIKPSFFYPFIRIYLYLSPVLRRLLKCHWWHKIRYRSEKKLVINLYISFGVILMSPKQQVKDPFESIAWRPLVGRTADDPFLASIYFRHRCTK